MATKAQVARDILESRRKGTVRGRQMAIYLKMIKKISIDIIDDQYDYVKRRLNFYYVKRRFDSIKVDYVRLKFNMSRD